MSTVYDTVAKEGYGQQIADKAAKNYDAGTTLTAADLAPMYGVGGNNYNISQVRGQSIDPGVDNYLSWEDVLKRGEGSSIIMNHPGNYNQQWTMNQDGTFTAGDINQYNDGSLVRGILGDIRDLGSTVANNDKLMLFGALTGGLSAASLAGVGQAATGGVTSPNAALSSVPNAISNYAPGAVNMAANGGAAAAGAAAGGWGSVLSNPGVIAAGLGAVGNAYVADRAGSVLRDGYEEDQAWKRDALARLRESYDNPAGYLEGDQYQAAQRVVHNQLQRRDAAQGVLSNDVMRQKLLQDHAMASLENYRNGLRSNAGLTNPNAAQYAQGVSMYSDILSPILSEIGRASTPKPGVSVSQDGTMNINWG